MKFSVSDHGFVELVFANSHTDTFTFHVKAPLAVALQWTDIDSFTFGGATAYHTPSHVYDDTGASVNPATATDVADVVNIHNHMCQQMYKEFVEAGIAERQARLVLPLSVYVEFDVTTGVHGVRRLIDELSTSAGQYAEALKACVPAAA